MKKTSVMRKIMVLMMAIAVVVAYSVMPMGQSYAASAKKPSKVKSVKAVSMADSATSIKVSWKKAKNAKKYQVYMATKKKGKYKKIATTKQVNYVKANLKNGKKYYFKVRAINGKKKGSYSKVVSATAKYVAPPSPSSAQDEVPDATEYYSQNAELIETIRADDSEDVFAEEDVKPFLENKGFGEYQITYDYSIYGYRTEDTEIDNGSDELHPMYQTYYISENGEAWAIYVINGEIFANPISFNLNSDLGAQLLFSESKTLTSYDDDTNQFYVTIPHSSEAIVHTVGEINAETLDGLTIEEICKLTGVSPSLFVEEDDYQEEDLSESEDSSALYDTKGIKARVANSGYSLENPLVVVSLGDSYSSGEGIEPFYSQDESLNNKVQIDDWLAHRSQKSWPSMLRVPGVEGTMANYKVPLDHTNNAVCQWYFAASSGAETIHFENGQTKKYDISTGLFSDPVKGQKTLPPQLDVFDGLWGKVDYVTFSIGGNDVGFADVIMTCATNSTYVHYGATSKLEDQLNDAWDNFYITEDNIYEAYQSVKSAAGIQASIIVAGYPQLLSPDGKGLVISKSEAQLVNKNVTKFNNRIKSIVKECSDEGMDIHFVNVESEFAGHAAYSKSPWINKIIFTKEAQDLDNHWFGSAYSMHPNANGAKAYARLVNAKIAELEENKANQLRIVLTWGDEPDDLDSHLVGPTADGERFHVYYAYPNRGDVNLDVDETDGYGRETIMVRKVNPGTYTYAVHNFSDKYATDSDTLSSSGAKVEVYRGSILLDTFSVPAEKGTLWTVFSYNSNTQELTPINDMSYEESSGEVLREIDTKRSIAPKENSEIEADKELIFNDINNNDKG